MKILLICLTLSVVSSAQAVPFNLREGYLIVVKCAIADITGLTAVVDTGVTETAIDLKLAKRLGLKMTNDVATLGTHQARVMAVSIPGVSLGSWHSDALAGIALDMAYAERSFGVRPDLILGMDFLQHESFFVDYKARQITFGTAPRLDHSVKLIPAERMLLVSAITEGRKVTLQVDTGFNGLLVYGGKVRVPGDDINTQAMSPVGGSAAHLASISLALGDWAARQITAALTDDEPRSPAAFDGLLGPTAIGAHQFAVDFKNQEIYWK
jgi:predicted aspartyl protease